MAERTTDLAATFDRLRAADADRTALLDDLEAALEPEPALAHLLRKARNLTASPHFAAALDDLAAAAGATAGVAGAGADDLETATRDELYEMAKEADIAGRSGMNKQELAEALRDEA